MNLRRCVAISALAMLTAMPALAQQTQSKAPTPPPRNYLDEALATGEKTGVGFADPTEKVDGPKTIAGTKSYESPLPYFRDLKPWDANYKPPRTPDGKPDLQGVWSTASLTTMVRGGNGDKVGSTLVIPAEKVAEFTRGAAYTRAADDSQKRTDPNAGLYTDKNAEAGYNAFWIDPGSEYAKVNNEWRSSWITSPADGRPPFSKAAMALRGERMENVKKVKNTGPEIRPLGERCFISFGSQGGPPLNNAMYNNNLQIVQTPGAVLIDVEMNHDARIINVVDKSGVSARPEPVKAWFGDSIGHWEGDTFVVVTKNFSMNHQKMGAFPVSDQGQVTEWFTRVADDVIDYKFEVKDPVYYTQTWTGQIPLRRSKEHLFEYACHAGNYAMPGILRADAEGHDTAIEAEGE
ncbi:MAG: hypothetical protein IPO30_06860 [Hyphomonadaceae bacterium]|nr:hypothetical protein [Hyphomonadaceae bacterium]